MYPLCRKLTCRERTLFNRFLLFCGNQGLIFQAVRPIDQAADVVNMRIAVGFELHRRHKAAAAALAVNKNRRIERGDLFLRGVFINKFVSLLISSSLFL